MIRLPKATKAPVKSKLIPRQSLAAIVKDLGESQEQNTCLTTVIHLLLCFRHTFRSGFYLLNVELKDNPDHVEH